MGRMIGNKLVFTKAEMTSPDHLLLHIEKALNCDGECGNSLFGDDGCAEACHRIFILWKASPVRGPEPTR